MPLATQAFPFLGILGALAVILGIALGPWAALPAAVLFLFVLWFFRDPERVAPEGEGIVLAPADGRVTAVTLLPEGARITIFLSILDCHINRSPVAGEVAEVRYTMGRFRPAWDRRAGSENERNHLLIRSSRGEYGVTQVAGVLARRIVCSVGEGDVIQRGERFGMIRFGSRTDLSLPAGVEPTVSVGERVKGGLTVVARERPCEAGAFRGATREEGAGAVS